MHYFQVVLCTLLVPSKIPRGISIENGGNRSGQQPGRPSARIKKNQGKSMFSGLAGQSKTSPAIGNPRKIIEIY